MTHLRYALVLGLTLASSLATAETVICQDSQFANEGDQLTVHVIHHVNDFEEYMETHDEYIRIDFVNAVGGPPTPPRIDTFEQMFVYDYTAQYTGPAEVDAVLVNDLPEELSEHSCEISLSVNLTKRLTDEQKAIMEGLSIAFAGLAVSAGTTAALCTAGIVTAPICGLPLSVIAALSGATAYVESSLLKLDPPDYNYTQIPAVVPPPFALATATTGITQEQADLFNAVLTNDAQILAVLRATVTSINRAATAQADGQSFWELQQNIAIQGFMRLLGFYLEKDAHAREQLAMMLEFEFFPATTIKWWDHIRIYQMGLFNVGFSPAEHNMLYSLGVDNPFDRAAIKRMMMTTHPLAPAGTYPNEFGEHADIMHAGARKLVTTLPEPNQWVGLAACAGLLALLRNRRSLLLLLPVAQAGTFIWIMRSDSILAFWTFTAVWLAGIVQNLLMWRMGRRPPPPQSPDHDRA